MAESGFDKEQAADATAIMLLDIEAVLVRPEAPFTLTSGKLSPVYVDCRRILSFPSERTRMMDFGASLLKQNIGIDNIDALAGGETAGIPFGAFLSDRLNKPMQYVRKKPKGFGRNARIEGVLEPGQHIVLIEDLATNGGTKIEFANVLREAGAHVAHSFVVFYYDIFEEARTELSAAGLSLHYLTTWWHILKEIKNRSSYSTQTCDALEAFLNAPNMYQQDNK